ncbi:MAG: MFS transporter [Chlamydiota bacterium]
MRQQDVIFSSKHPTAIYLLAATEMCQRFAYWGVYYLLVLFLVNYFKYTIPDATSFFAIYTGLAAALHLLGGYIADKWNDRSPIFLGMLLTTLGCFLFLPLKAKLLIPALGCIGLGGGLFNPTAYSLLGRLYTKHYHIREGGFSIYYVIVNLGSFFGLIVLGYLQTIHWRYAFFLAGCAPLIGLIPYRYALRRLKKISRHHHHFISKEQDPHTFPLKRHERDRIFVILMMTFISIFFWIAYNQAGSSITLFALNYTHRDIGSFRIPVPWFTALYILFLAILAFPLANFYLFLRRIKSSASPPMRTALSLFFLGLCFIVMQRAAAPIPIGSLQGSAPFYYLVLAFALMALAELFLTPIIFSLVTNLSPHRYRGVLTGCWFACMGIGLYIGGSLTKLMTVIRLASFFDIFIFTSFIPAFLILLFSKKLDAMRHIDSL